VRTKGVVAIKESVAWPVWTSTNVLRQHTMVPERVTEHLSTNCGQTKVNDTLVHTVCGMGSKGRRRPDHSPEIQLALP